MTKVDIHITDPRMVKLLRSLIKEEIGDFYINNCSPRHSTIRKCVEWNIAACRLVGITQREYLRIAKEALGVDFEDFHTHHRIDLNRLWDPVVQLVDQARSKKARML